MSNNASGATNAAAGISPSKASPKASPKAAAANNTAQAAATANNAATAGILPLKANATAAASATASSQKVSANNAEKKAKAAAAAEKEKLNELFKALETNYIKETETFDISIIDKIDGFKEEPKIIKLLQELNKSNNYSKEGNEALYKIKRYLSEHTEADTDNKINVFKELCTASENLISTAP